LVSWKRISLPKNLGGLGIQTAREANTSLLGKLVWDLVQSTNKLWVSLLSNKYTGGHNTLLASASSISSPTWSSIIRAKNILKEGYTCRISLGSSSFWFSNWNPLGHIGNYVPIIDIHDLHLTVRDVLSATGNRTQHLDTNLPLAIENHINNIHTQFNDNIEDALIWSHNKNGTYSAKSGFNWLLNLRDPAADPFPHISWSWIWRIKVLEKFKFLIWLACQNVVPTLSLLHRRNITPSPTCVRCREEDETFLHCVRDCRFSRIIWQNLWVLILTQPIQLTTGSSMVCLALNQIHF
jgi:hypothetical protein